MNISIVAGIISALLSLIKLFVGLAQQQKWVSDGEAQAILASLEESDNAVARAKAARDTVVVDEQRNPAGVLRDDDGYKRPDS